MQVSAAGRRAVDSVFIGRNVELARLVALLGDRCPQVLFVHGLAGSGKSTLVQRFGVHAERSGALVLALDCRAVEPTEQGFFAALGRP
jgi:predicted alpha/beta-fold hydrolase